MFKHIIGIRFNVESTMIFIKKPGYRVLISLGGNEVFQVYVMYCLCTITLFTAFLSVWILKKSTQLTGFLFKYVNNYLNQRVINSKSTLGIFLRWLESLIGNIKPTLNWLFVHRQRFSVAVIAHILELIFYYFLMWVNRRPFKIWFDVPGFWFCWFSSLGSGLWYHPQSSFHKDFEPLKNQAAIERPVINTWSDKYEFNSYNSSADHLKSRINFPAVGRKNKTISNFNFRTSSIPTIECYVLNKPKIETTKIDIDMYVYQNEKDVRSEV